MGQASDLEVRMTPQGWSGCSENWQELGLNWSEGAEGGREGGVWPGLRRLGGPGWVENGGVYGVGGCWLVPQTARRLTRDRRGGLKARLRSLKSIL